MKKLTTKQLRQNFRNAEIEIDRLRTINIEMLGELVYSLYCEGKELPEILVKECERAESEITSLYCVYDKLLGNS